ncbi:unnamed protein product, partial [Mesorhabditis belari]|uniref:Uncharacterized protein n=1 Tax=Mesorhabditis belari TaxID=2138241 RepID=A0AAF3ET63_9BILA
MIRFAQVCLFGSQLAHLFVNSSIFIYGVLMLLIFPTILLTCGGKKKEFDENVEEDEKTEKPSISLHTAESSTGMRECETTSSSPITTKQIAEMKARRGETIFFCPTPNAMRQIHKASRRMPINKTMSMNDVERNGWKNGITEMNARRILEKRRPIEQMNALSDKKESKKGELLLSKLTASQLNANWIV